MGKKRSQIHGIGTNSDFHVSQFTAHKIVSTFINKRFCAFCLTQTISLIDEKIMKLLVIKNRSSFSLIVSKKSSINSVTDQLTPPRFIADVKEIQLNRFEWKASSAANFCVVMKYSRNSFVATYKKQLEIIDPQALPI